ncbi:flavin reductase family protein [Bacillus tequilensis]|uniref:flavin reductase family protein n=1 Tax=Bacillus tequilensis TaxID=227866 RepID=UPI000466FACD|nr:flavin reductase family protein [Bacillus tequilensis]MDR4435174.1 flavin reductase family protein [Bacillus tequilensis]SPU01728.1 flavoprotein [Bacillus tequilensis]
MDIEKQDTLHFKEIKPTIMYYGTPAFLLTTLNEDGTTNISPMSSSWALGNYIVLGVGLGGKAIENLERHNECVINLPGPELWEHVERISSYSGKKSIPPLKKQLGFAYKKEKYEAAGLTPLQSKTVLPTRIQECPIQIEAEVKHIRIPEYDSSFAIVETQALHFHAEERIILNENHINPSKWSPLIYNFRHYFGLGRERGKTFRSET